MKMSLMQKLWIGSWRYLSWVLPRQTALWAEDLFLTPSRVPRPLSEEGFYKSSEKITLPGGIAAYAWGSSDHPVVLLVHGWSGRGTQMGAFAEPLVEKGFRVVAVDGPAHGASQGLRTNVGDYARFMIEAQQSLGPLKAVVAHSFGAGCSVLAVHRGMQAEKLVLVAGPSRYELVVNNYLKFIGLSGLSQKHFFRSLEVKVGMPASEMNVGRIGNGLNVPALIVHDEEDKEVRYKAALEIHETWPRTELLATQGLGHRRILKDPVVTQKVADFISR
ncbi:alpha/beta hydrolase [Bdellovibrio bacteriovorus]|uniref:alpha/beta hydrolase n=1 Tax=Bdellovibrio bacteriovorus TaxID=959 RepID=UPI0021D379F9|nr:alpha/beta hydrolase [Bdellovibrio bacteriovorus]UXR63481.1 alpha/beta hydrolase [Bdellovibrio bacteriovorus]